MRPEVSEHHTKTHMVKLSGKEVTELLVKALELDTSLAWAFSFSDRPNMHSQVDDRGMLRATEVIV